jgi:hypothetical protein
VKAVNFWLLAGFPISVVDAWLSIQSTAGMMHAIDPVTYVMAALVGLSLTGFAVFLPTLKQGHDSVAFSAFWFTLTLIDVGTSVVGTIWYGMLHQPFTQPVDFSLLRFVPGNWLMTLLFVAFVVLVAWCCVMFGKAIQSRKSK